MTGLDEKCKVKKITLANIDFENFLNAVPDAMVLVDDAGNIIEFNRQAEHMLGFTRDHVVGQPIEMLLPERYRKQHIGHRDSFIKDQSGPRNMEVGRDLVALRKDGTELPAEFTLSTLETQSGRMIIVAFRDVTPRRLAEQALIESEKYNRRLFETSPIGLALCRMNGELADINPAFANILGRTIEETLPLSYWDITPEKYASAEQQQLEQLNRTGRYGPYEKEYLHKDGHLVPVRLHGLLLEKGGENYIWSSVEDITEQKQAEQALANTAEELKRMHAKTELLLSSTREGILGVDNKGRCTFINKAGAEMLGYLPEDLYGQDIQKQLQHSHEDGSPYLGESGPIARTIQQAKSHWTNEEVLWHKNGNCVPVELSVSPINDNNSVTGAVVVFHNISEARAMARKMDYLATHDALTGLLNRHEFEARLQAALDSAQAEQSTHILGYLDLDQFKVVNDTCGHVAGDELLRQLSTLLHARLRKQDTFARLGGDEFGVLLEYCDLQEAKRVVDSLRETVQDFRFVWEEKTFALGVSIGVVEINEQTENLADALSAADAACYMAKDSGRNRVHVYETDDAELAMRHGEMQWVSRLHEALEQDRFMLRYQPIIPIESDGELTECFEILIGMKDSMGHVVPPGAFLPAAERFNLAPAIDRWVVLNTFDWFEAHPGHLTRLGFCTINLSGNTIGDVEFLHFLVHEIKQRFIPAEKICFEITETAAIANLNSAVVFISELKRLGCRFALDDFGSGMSSFAYLKNLSVDFLKIDGNFVRDIVTDNADRAMVEAINQVGHVMGIQTIAEHVENTDIMAALEEIGVDYVQGYACAKPRLLNELASQR